MALNFAASSSEDVTRSSDLGIAGKSATLECWLKLDAEPGDGTVYAPMYLATAAPTGIEYAINYRGQSGTNQWEVRRSRVGVADDQVTLVQDAGTGWNHIALVYDGSNVVFYLNGVNKGSASSRGNGTGNPTTSFVVGANNRAGKSEFLTGKVDEVRVWDVARTQAQVQRDMFRRIAGDETSPVAGTTFATLLLYWRLDDGQGTAPLDFTQRGNTGTFSNFP